VNLDEERSLQKKGEYSTRVFSRILDAAARRQESEDQLRRTTRELRTRVASVLNLTVGVSNTYFEL
jgi:hypothetical protein